MYRQARFMVALVAFAAFASAKEVPIPPPQPRHEAKSEAGSIIDDELDKYIDLINKKINHQKDDLEKAESIQNLQNICSKFNEDPVFAINAIEEKKLQVLAEIADDLMKLKNKVAVREQKNQEEKEQDTLDQKSESGDEEIQEESVKKPKKPWQKPDNINENVKESKEKRQNRMKHGFGFVLVETEKDIELQKSMNNSNSEDPLPQQSQDEIDPLSIEIKEPNDTFLVEFQEPSDPPADDQGLSDSLILDFEEPRDPLAFENQVMIDPLLMDMQEPNESLPIVSVEESETEQESPFVSAAFSAKMESCDWDSYMNKCISLTHYEEYARCGTTFGCGQGINFESGYLAVGPGSIQAPLPCNTACTSLCEQNYAFNQQLYTSCFKQTCGCEY